MTHFALRFVLICWCTWMVCIVISLFEGRTTHHTLIILKKLHSVIELLKSAVCIANLSTEPWQSHVTTSMFMEHPADWFASRELIQTPSNVTFQAVGFLSPFLSDKVKWWMRLSRAKEPGLTAHPRPIWHHVKVEQEIRKNENLGKDTNIHQPSFSFWAASHSQSHTLFLTLRLSLSLSLSLSCLVASERKAPRCTWGSEGGWGELSGSHCVHVETITQ